MWNSRPWYAEVIARWSGGSASRIIGELEAGASIVRVAEDRQVTRAQLTRAVKDDGGSIELYEGVLQTLDSLQERKSLIGIVSNLPGWLVAPLLQSTGIDKYITATATPRAGVLAKPKPHGIRRVLHEMGRDADARTWFVGDGAVDAEAAAAAGVQFAWASYGYCTEAPPGTTKVLKRFEDVLQL
ncbi:MAG: HAD hydrolase-like protein [Deltaproteobacteria bacterium]|nr:HAD hydrolase-like protein [Deltaproteobacteria bacterium]